MADIDAPENKEELNPEEGSATAAWEDSLSEGREPAKESGSDEVAQVLSQEEIDNLLGFEGSDKKNAPKTGINALLDNSLLSYDRLPMLEVVFDRFVRMASSSLRNFTSDNVDVDIQAINSVRFGDYINSIPMPALLSIFKAVEWDNFGIVTTDNALIYSIVDILFGGRKSHRPIRVEGRPYTTIEQTIVRHMTEIMLNDLAAAFDPLSPATFELERLETNPRFATISHPADGAILLQLRVDMEERGGNIEILIPYSTLDPIRDLLTQVFMGEKFGKDIVWEAHLNREIQNTAVDVVAILGKKSTMMSDIMKLKIGSTIVFEKLPEDDVIISCGDVPMLSGKLGRKGENIAVRVNTVLQGK